MPDLYDAVAYGMWAYSQGAFRVETLGSPRLRLPAGTLIVATHRKETDVPILCPPLYFRAAERFTVALRLWTPARLQRALERLLEAELAAKRTGAPDQALVEQVLLEIALAARAGAGRGRQSGVLSS